MAGGIFITQNKIRPGFYHKFTAIPRAKKFFAAIGIAALPLELDWGIADIASLDADGMDYDFLHAIGRTRDDCLLVREALKRAHTLLVYRVNAGGNKASLDMTPQPLLAEARCTGIRGNDIAVQITDDEDRPGRYTVSTYVDAILRDEQTGIANAEEILNNDWVKFSGTGAITSAAGGQLSGGTNGTPSENDYQAFLTALESWDFNAYGLPKDDSGLKSLFIEASKKFIEQQGKLVQCILPNAKAEYEAVTSLQNGVVLTDGSKLDKADAVAWFTGAAAAAGPATSLTYTSYDGAVAPDVRFDDAKTKTAIQNGHVVFTAQKNVNGDPVAVVEQDIDTLVRYTENRPQPWGKNRVVRALFYLVNSLTRVWHLYYIGKVDNNEAGRNLFKADLASMMRTLVEQGAFENFDAETDITIAKGNTSDSVVATLAVQPVDAMEKMYFTVELQ